MPAANETNACLRFRVGLPLCCMTDDTLKP